MMEALKVNVSPEGGDSLQMPLSPKVSMGQVLRRNYSSSKAKMVNKTSNLSLQGNATLVHI